MFSDDGQARAELFARRLEPYVDRLLARRRAEQHGDRTLPARAKLRLDGVVGRSAALAGDGALDQIAMVARLEVAVLFSGESGTGKTQLAQVIHDNSARAAGPFVQLNCAALPETLIESEFFGALPGAHSTATRRVEGKIAAAEGGTLSSTKSADLPLASQGRLLEVLHSKRYYPLGSGSPERVRGTSG